MPAKKRKVFRLAQPRELTDEECDELAAEAERYRKALDPKLAFLDAIADIVWKIRMG